MSENVICPYCGYGYTELDESTMPNSLTLSSSFNEECLECGKVFVVIRIVKPIYSTVKKGQP